MFANLGPIALLPTIACLSVGCHFERDGTDAAVAVWDVASRPADSALDTPTIEASPQEVPTSDLVPFSPVDAEADAFDVVLVPADRRPDDQPPDTSPADVSNPADIQLESLDAQLAPAETGLAWEDAQPVDATADSADGSISVGDTRSVNERPSSTSCAPHDISFYPSQNLLPTGGSVSKTPCAVTTEGLVLTYTIGATTWNGCEFAKDPVVPLLDADRPDGGTGLLAVRICTIGPPATGSLDLYYGTFPTQRRWALYKDGKWSNGQPLSAGLCTTLQLRPDEAIYPSRTTQGGVTYPPVGCAASQDQCGSKGVSCEPARGFDSTLSMVAEWPPSNTSGAVRVESVQYFPEDCLCQEDSGCPANASCFKVANQSSCSGTAVSGVCSTCAGQGESCQVTAGSKSCLSTIVCNQGLPLCPCSPE